MGATGGRAAGCSQAGGRADSDGGRSCTLAATPSSSRLHAEEHPHTHRVLVATRIIGIFKFALFRTNLNLKGPGWESTARPAVSVLGVS